MRRVIPADPWHYPRPKLAAKYLQTFDLGLTSARALFAKRRMGKSEFLEQDLIPAARELGYMFNDANFVQVWHHLLPADRELLSMIASGHTDLFSEASRQCLGESLGLDQAVTKNVPQQSLRRLQEADLVIRMDYGNYQIQDDALGEWVRNRDIDAQ